MPHEFDPCEAPTEGEVDKWGFTIKPTISDDELILRCVRNAPCGCDRKQAMNLIKIYEDKINSPDLPSN
tara:strand:- start:359 stop:565 length:207 start_codon:yes stop_codon:yes gene_type:complete